MGKFTKLAVTALFGMAVVTTTASADAAKGQKLYSKKLKKACGFKGSDFAAKHTQAEWEKLMEDGKIAEEIKTLCPAVEDKALKDKYIPHYFDFGYEFAKDSGNVPAC